MAAKTIFIRHPLRIEHLPDFVGLMAINTSGKNTGLFFPELTADDLSMDHLNLGMAFSASVGNVGARDGRSGVCMRQDGMGRMTRDARGSDNQTLEKQTLTVDTLGVILDNAVLWNRTLLLDGRTLTVTFSTQSGNL